MAFGTRGDVQPICLLAHALAEAGHAVRVATNGDYARTVAGYGVPYVDVGLSFGETFREAAFEKAFTERHRRPLALLEAVRRYGERMSERMPAVLTRLAEEVRAADLVVYTTLGWFAGALAAEAGVPSVFVAYQPLEPTGRFSSVLMSGRDFGAPLNRLSYELMRGASLLTWGAVRRFRRETGLGRRLRPWTSPVGLALAQSHQIRAYSPTLAEPIPSPDATETGFWLRPPRPGEGLPEAVEAFLTAGPPPVYVGFGSMLWGARRNTRLVMEALALWGGRAIVATGVGGLARPEIVPPNILFVGSLPHALLFPRVAAAVHHGGAGTTAQALACGLPCVILPVASDQLFWGRAVAARAAAEAPVPITKIDPATLAARIAQATSDPAMRDAARRLGAMLTRESGLPGAVARIEAMLERQGAADPLGSAAPVSH
ncbi:glycosyltransferase [Methylobacterium sp. Leaf456]|uniref:glycosyltransferase n=1 Tax=Methylobacterium sp. Leaf456 TaxID=1736382 RepID=UPI00138F1950|nr:glycosyltransferase [Methylobacterium sp. Leaf456]